MSSTTYSTELRPDRFLRRVVTISGLLATALGLAILLVLPVPLWWRGAAAAVWTGVNVRELSHIYRGHKRCRRIRIGHNGDISVLSEQGTWSAANLVAGSVVLSRWAWLRFEFADGHRCAELLRGRAPENEQWRRLQVIWRHL